MFFYAFACTAALCLAGCSRSVQPTPVLNVDHEISPSPARIGPATIILKLADATAQPVPKARITVEADMSHPGMSPIFTEAKEDAPGHYRAHLQFSMAGDWVILLHVTLPGGKKMERQIDVDGVRPN